MNKGIKVNTKIIDLRAISNNLNYGQIYNSLEILQESYNGLLEGVEEMRDILTSNVVDNIEEINHIKDCIATLQLQAGYAETNVLILKEALEMKENKLIINDEIGDIVINYSLN